MPIFDQGYQHWQGPLSGHAWRWLAIAQHGVRVQMKNRILRFLVLLAWLPALGLVGAVALWGLVEQQSENVLLMVQRLLPAEVLMDPRAYRVTAWTLAYSVFFKVQLFLIMLLVTVAGPGLISRDLRFNALPLYFARPMTRLDYFLGKLGVIGALVATVAVGPAVFAYVVGICFCLDLSVVKDTYLLLLSAVAYGVVITLSVGTIMLALSSLTRRSLYVAIAWAGFWLISGAVGTVMTQIHRDSVRRGIAEAELARWLAGNPPPPGIQMRGSRPVMRFDPGARKMRPIGVPPDREEETERWFNAWLRTSQLSWDRAQVEEGEVARRDWRPLCSYSANLDRIADLLLDTDAAWVTVGKAFERPRAMMGAAFGPPGFGRLRAERPPPNERRLADRMVAQYPWEWSAGVLAGLLGLSTWTLTRRVKSLDRLK
jgi:ABC-type transport system involved in multi-copper enzyme maturation permease subunit